MVTEGQSLIGLPDIGDGTSDKGCTCRSERPAEEASDNHCLYVRSSIGRVSAATEDRVRGVTCRAIMTCVSMKKKVVAIYKRKRPNSSDKADVKSGTRPNPSGYTLKATVAAKVEQWRSCIILGKPMV